MPLHAQPNPLTPYPMVLRRSVAASTGETLISGRWAKLTANNQAAAAVAADGANAFLMFEGLQKASEDETYDGSTYGNLALGLVNLPAAVGSNQVSLGYGIYRFEINRVGFGTISGNTPGLPLYLDAQGRLTTSGGAGIIPVATLERYITDEKIVARTVAVNALGS